MWNKSKPFTIFRLHIFGEDIPPYNVHQLSEDKNNVHLSCFSKSSCTVHTDRHRYTLAQTCGFSWHILYSYLFALNAQMPFQETDGGLLHNSMINPMFVRVPAVGSSPSTADIKLRSAVFHQTGFSVPEKNNSPVPNLYSSNQPWNWGPLTHITCNHDELAL